MKNLIARLEAAEVGSRELDHLVFMCTAPMEVLSHWSPSDRMTLYTTSVDAALALSSRTVTGSFPGLNMYTNVQHWTASLGREKNEDLTDHAVGYGKTPAIALCIAILKAKLAESPTKG